MTKCVKVSVSPTEKLFMGNPRRFLLGGLWLGLALAGRHTLGAEESLVTIDRALATPSGGAGDLRICDTLLLRFNSLKNEKLFGAADQRPHSPEEEIEFLSKRNFFANASEAAAWYVQRKLEPLIKSKILHQALIRSFEKNGVNKRNWEGMITRFYALETNLQNKILQDAVVDLVREIHPNLDADEVAQLPKVAKSYNMDEQELHQFFSYWKKLNDVDLTYLQDSLAFHLIQEKNQVLQELKDQGKSGMLSGLFGYQRTYNPSTMAPLIHENLKSGDFKVAQLRLSKFLEVASPSRVAAFLDQNELLMPLEMIHAAMKQEPKKLGKASRDITDFTKVQERLQKTGIMDSETFKLLKQLSDAWFERAIKGALEQLSPAQIEEILTQHSRRISDDTQKYLHFYAPIARIHEKGLSNIDAATLVESAAALDPKLLKPIIFRHFYEFDPEARRTLAEAAQLDPGDRSRLAYLEQMETALDAQTLTVDNLKQFVRTQDQTAVRSLIARHLADLPNDMNRILIENFPAQIGADLRHRLELRQTVETQMARKQFSPDAIRAYVESLTRSQRKQWFAKLVSTADVATVKAVREAIKGTEGAAEYFAKWDEYLVVRKKNYSVLKATDQAAELEGQNQYALMYLQTNIDSLSDQISSWEANYDYKFSPDQLPSGSSLQKQLMPKRDGPTTTVWQFWTAMNALHQKREAAKKLIVTTRDKTPALTASLTKQQEELQKINVEREAIASYLGLQVAVTPSEIELNIVREELHEAEPGSPNKK